ncbi:hypothetical protein SYNTR_1216 [Candidatus Syntrophocurvum alkaliphilum]|uniref:SMODS-associated and fused to various effectors domain-containing protein n=1 Tax=Candidatus Syntrophocurvum alkaliphilum TaxID=2293317 RepID=A0A6I6DC18_9FIRM|nr:SAVED domain-containing protein [Candidatus Syntrophocurvum alkaliphilum]QGT99809.1 hypothetical protein SYNTR_1216 [Candidatus Syntrophocurvum alkaliphilum]
MPYLDIVSYIGSITSIIAFIPVLYALWLLITVTKKRKQELERIRREPGQRPVFLIVDALVDQDIQAQVENYIANQPEFEQFKRNGTIPKDMIIYYSHNYEINNSNIDKIVKDIRKSKSQIQKKGVDKIHLFMAGPIMLAAVIGAELSNMTSTLIYQNTPNKGYECWGPMQRPN